MPASAGLTPKKNHAAIHNSTNNFAERQIRSAVCKRAISIGLAKIRESVGWALPLER